MSLDELEEKQVEEDAKVEIENNNAVSDEPVKLTKSIITTIVAPLILIAFSAFIYLMNETSLAGLIVAIILSIAFGVIIFLGGFYFFIIPLPFISVVPNGCLRKLPKRKKIILQILCVLSVVLTFVALFVLR